MSGELLVGVLIAVGFIIFIIAGYVLLQIQKILEKNMNESHFVVRKPLITLIGALLLTAVCTMLAIIFMFINTLAGIAFIFIAFVGLCNIANNIRWKVEVNGQTIYFRSLFELTSKTFSFVNISKTATFTFADISKAVSTPAKYIGNIVTLYSADTGSADVEYTELLSINTWSRGWSIFKARLIQENIEIVLTQSADGYTKPDELPKMDRKLKKVLWWMFGACMVTLVLFLLIIRAY